MAPKYPIHDDIQVPENIQENWQITADLLAEITGVPAALIVRVHAAEIETFISSHSSGNVFLRGEKAKLDTGLYCEAVMSSRRKLVVPNALKDPDWDDNPDVALGMISYCGLPLIWPDGGLFGTFCVLDNKENAYSTDTQRLLERFHDSIQLSLVTIYEAHLARSDAEAQRRYKDELEIKVRERTADLVLARDAAEAANQAKSVFLANMTHQLRTPLSAILGFSAMLCSDPQATKEQRERLEIINRSGEDLLTLINDILEITKIEAEHQELDIAPFDPGALLREVADITAVRQFCRGRCVGN